MVEVSFSGNHETERIRRLDICEIVEPRAEEILQMVLSEVNDSGYVADMISYVILTGGTASLEGIVELAEEVFQAPRSARHSQRHRRDGGNHEEPRACYRCRFVVIWG